MFCLPSSRIWFICAEFWLDKKQFPYWRIANCLGKNEPLPLSRTLDCVLNNFWNRKWSNSRKNQQFWTDPGTKSSKQSFKNIPILIINVSFSFYIIYDIFISAARVNDILNRWIDQENRIHCGRYSGSKFPVPSIISSTFYQFTGIRFPELAFRNVHD